jgi:hypothetical protein
MNAAVACNGKEMGHLSLKKDGCCSYVAVEYQLFALGFQGEASSQSKLHLWMRKLTTPSHPELSASTCYMPTNNQIRI